MQVNAANNNARETCLIVYRKKVDVVFIITKMISIRAYLIRNKRTFNYETKRRKTSKYAKKVLWKESKRPFKY